MIVCTVNKGRGLLAVLVDHANVVCLEEGQLARASRGGYRVAQGRLLTVDRASGGITIEGYAPEDGDVLEVMT